MSLGRITQPASLHKLRHAKIIEGPSVTILVLLGVVVTSSYLQLFKFKLVVVTLTSFKLARTTWRNDSEEPDRVPGSVRRGVPAFRSGF